MICIILKRERDFESQNLLTCFEVIYSFWRKIVFATVTVIFWSFIVFYYGVHSPQVKSDLTSSRINFIQLLNDLRLNQLINQLINYMIYSNTKPKINLNTVA